MNTGPTFLHQRWDPRGYASHLAQQVADAAEAGQILVTKKTLDEARNLDPEFAMNLGREIALREGKLPVPIYEVAH